MRMQAGVPGISLITNQRSNKWLDGVKPDWAMPSSVAIALPLLS